MQTPDRIIMAMPNATYQETRGLALTAEVYARRNAPKNTGSSASRIRPIYGRGYFGLRWADDRVWFQNSGIRGFTMSSLSGKVVPMWIDDPTGSERQKNPKAKTRVTASGKPQILIFRKATKVGQPGKISLREAPRPWTTPGKTPGAIAPGNVGMKWYHPGLTPRNFLEHALERACRDHGIFPGEISIGRDFYNNQRIK